MGSTHSGTPSPSWAMIEDSIEEFLTMSCMEGGFGLPSPRRCDTGALSAPVKTTPWMENALATQATMTVPSRMAALRSNAGLPFEQRHTHQGGGGQQAQACARQPTAEGKATSRCSKLTDRQAAMAVQPHVPPHHDLALESEDPDVGFCLHSSWAKEVAPLASTMGARLRPLWPSP
jgi:hypothetical protein